MTQETIPEATPARSSIHPAVFTSRRNLLARRFIRNKPAVVALILLALLFIGCYALPPLLPYGYNDLDYDALLQPPSLEHWFGTNTLGQDLLAVDRDHLGLDLRHVLALVDQPRERVLLGDRLRRVDRVQRSEEHTSELQSRP